MRIAHSDVDRCFHCNEPIQPNTRYGLNVGGVYRAVCCPGCLAVAQMIQEQGLERFYDFRSAPALRPATAERDWGVCDRDAVEERLTRAVGPDVRELRCQIDGINCAACVWLLDRGLRANPGISEVSVNPVSGEALIRYAPASTRLSDVLAEVSRFGFTPHPRLNGATGSSDSTERHAELKRLAVAGFGFAQVMTLSAALYLGAFKAMDIRFESFFVLASLLIATPVVLYSGAPIFRSAWETLARGRLGMDVPVALAISVAIAASLFNAFRGTGAVYFDSATMFVFFLTLGRFLESRARHRAGGVFAALGELTPLSATRRSGSALETVGTIELEIGDHVLVAPGGAVPADGVLLSPSAAFDEALLSGESSARRRSAGDAVLGGSLNLGHEPVEIEVARLGNDSYVAHVGSLLQRAMADRPEFLAIADRWASWFIAVILAATALTGSAWLALAPERAFGVVLAMLVVTCPCALSLAAPTAFAVALGQLAKQGLLLRSARALERLAAVDLWLFDKTGTLTQGHIGITRIVAEGEWDAASCLAAAAALESAIEHPLAQAMRERAVREGLAPPAATQIEYVPGYGVTGTVADRRLRLGSARYVGLEVAPSGDAGLFLTDEHRLLARFEVSDTLRPHAKAMLAELVAGGAQAELVSGDGVAAVAATARELEIADFTASCDPAAKLALLESRQHAGRTVAAVGDGINDAPLLAQADVSIAMISGSQLAKTSADVLFTGSDLRVLAHLPKWSAATRRAVRQNLLWAACYNLVTVPLAGAGLLAPWMAALGMSLSSLVVVGNALRLGGKLRLPQSSGDRSQVYGTMVEDGAR
jgi:Cu2+-exporting ATPase